MTTENKPLTIRKAQPVDSLSLSHLAQAGFPGYPFLGVYQPEYISQKISEGELRWVVESDLGILATAVLGGDDVMREICKVVVNPMFRGNGVGKKITQALYDEALANDWHPWADVRAVQPAMQRSALAAGLQPISVESGKHVVYYHQSQLGEETSPARESMVHFTSLDLEQINLKLQLDTWKPDLKMTLLNNLEESMADTHPDRKLANSLLPTAEIVKSRIHNNLESIGLASPATSSSDFEILNLSGNTILVIKPDASAFILGLEQPENLDLGLFTHAGLQVITSYHDVTDYQTIEKMAEVGMVPAMVRPWKKSAGSKAVWQTGCRKYLNQGEKVIEPAVLDESIKTQLYNFLSTIY